MKFIILELLLLSVNIIYLITNFKAGKYGLACFSAGAVGFIAAVTICLIIEEFRS